MLGLINFSNDQQNNHMDQIRPDGQVQHLFQRRNDKEVANQFSLSVPECQVNPDASCFPFYSTEDRAVECTGIPSNSKGQGVVHFHTEFFAVQSNLN